MGRIAVLSEELINKIAAGEVVERPASVVKELAENSLDAEARNIRIALSAGGCEKICVTDDGCGMSSADAQLALMRHATSKMRDLGDLFHIATLGFRGEALPAIASVSRLVLTTAERHASAGCRISVEGGEIVERRDAAPIAGTSIEVEDLFFNVPARRKFMRRRSTELAHAQEAAIRLALAHPEVGFFLEHEGKALLSSPACPQDPRERLGIALGSEVHPHLMEVEERRLTVRVTGYAATPDFTLPNARGVYTFVNRRYIRDRGLNHAIQRAFRDALPAGRQPVIALFIEIDPRSVDVNVHPQKLEVRFADAASVYDSVFAALQRVLRPVPSSPGAPGLRAGETGVPSYALAVQQFLERARGAPWGGPLPFHAAEPPIGPYGGTLPTINDAPPPRFFSSLRYLGTVANQYWVCEGGAGSLVAVDSHAALERVRRGAFERALGDDTATTQRSLFSTNVDVTPQETRVLVAHSDLLSALNLEVEPFGPSGVALKSLPSALLGADYKKLLSDLAAALSQNGSASQSRVIQTLACHAAHHASLLSGEQILAVFQELDRSDFACECIHGSVVALDVPLLRLRRSE